MAIFFQRTATIAEIVDRFVPGSREHRLLSEQTIPPRYGISPGMQALDELKAFNALPADERAKAVQALFNEMDED